MRIAFIGAQNVGKTTVIDELIAKWPMYKRPAKTYRDLIKKQDLKLNREADTASQEAILNALVDELQEAVASGEEHIVFDRCPVDNLAYSLWHYEMRTPGFNEEFIIKCKTIAALSLKHLDAIFYLPIRPEIPVVEKENREVDLAYREDIDNIFNALVLSYERNTGAFFPREDCAPIIRLDGPADLRVPQLQLYINEAGNCYGEETPSLIDPSKL